MKNKNIWFEGSNTINCDIKQVIQSFKNLSEHYVGVVNKMPGMTNVELVKKGSDFVVIKTNEGVMKRTNIVKTIKPDSIFVEFDEEYKTKLTTVTTHYKHIFTKTKSGVNHQTILSILNTSGFLGFIYKLFAKKNIGKAILTSYKEYFEK